MKRRFTQVNGEGITVLTYEADGGLTPVGNFDTWAAAKKAYPAATKASNCPDDVTVTKDDVKRQYPFPALMADGGTGTGE